MAKMMHITPYSTATTLVKLDGRTREARLMRQTRKELVEHVGGQPSATQRALIERAVSLALRIGLMDAKFAEGGMTDHDTRTYLAWSNAYSRLLRHLGLKGAPQHAPTVQERVAAFRAQQDAAA